VTVTVRRLLPIGVLIGVVLLVVAIVLSATPVASVRTVTVTGADPVLNRKAQAALDDAVGTPIVRVDTGELRQEVIALSPSVKDADVRRVLPGTVEVTLVRRAPVLMWTDRAASTTWLVDAEGVVFGKDTRAPAGTPMLVVSDQLSGDERRPRC
jgi:cell division protein FtsQ